MEKKDVSGVFLYDAKPRLKWSPQLHGLFVLAVGRLGGADKATPKSLLKAMGIPGLTLFHLKSHLQKHRLGKGQHAESYKRRVVVEESEGTSMWDSVITLNANISTYSSWIDLMHAGFEETLTKNGISGGFHIQINENLQRSDHGALQMQNKIQEQVQRHLEVRMEAEGKYLQSILDNAHQLIHGGCSISMEGISPTPSSSCESSVTKFASNGDYSERSPYKISKGNPFRIMLDLNK